ncbi:MAG: pyruvate/2-oxoglutarate dehydrogenase complex, dihydrolipoamide dehydrogenase component [Gemmatimonadetes bacterium]|nr:pyruvate/2-oxoglutarate dehydrogenase complex, dihydrolipoamide dehydrogenase component [Gemmatimonadota bacterium]
MTAKSTDTEHFDLIVIGAGPAGEKGAAQAAYFGKRVCLVERAPKPGGAAVNTGTIPSKTLRETALYFSGFRQRGLYGVDLRVKHDITISDFMQRERAVIESEWGLIAENIEKHQITTVQGAARFLDAHTIEVVRYGLEPRRLTADVYLVATGARPEPPRGYELLGETVVDSETLLTIQKIPSSMIVVGGGVIGCEYACIFAALGVRVTLVNERGRLLSHLDADVSDALRQSMTARLNVTVYGNAEIRSVDVGGNRAQVTLSDGTLIPADLVLVATGRMGNSAGLGLEALGVRVNAQSFVHVDSNFRTAVPHIYAAGDVIGFPALASAAMEQARVAVCHAFDLRYKRSVSSVLPYGVWTIPEIATVGESEDSLLARGIAFETGRASFRLNARGQILGDVDGFVKIVFSPEDQRVLGVTIVGEGACELIHVGMTVIALEGTLDFFIQAAFGFPSLSDAYKYAAYDGLQQLQRRHARSKGLPSVNVNAAAAD